MEEQTENSSFNEQPDIAEQKPKKGRRGPAAGKWQNGRGCFSAWYSARFIVSLRRLAAMLQMEPAELVQSKLDPILQSVRLTEGDLAELRAAEESRNGRAS